MGDPPGGGRPHALNAGNRGPFTLDGTRTYVVGRRRPAVIDPGPDRPRHIRAVVDSVRGADEVSVLLTHGHPDHAAGTDSLVEALGAEGISARSFGATGKASTPIEHGDSIATDDGEIIAVATPGHARSHLAFHWPARKALFPGDLVLGEGETTWVAGYPGCVADYLASIARVRALDLEIMYPTHGEPITDPVSALDRFEGHRRKRIRQVRAILTERPDATAEDIVRQAYGDSIPRGLDQAAIRSVSSLMEYVRSTPDEA